MRSADDARIYPIMIENLASERDGISHLEDHDSSTSKSLKRPASPGRREFSFSPDIALR